MISVSGKICFMCFVKTLRMDRLKNNILFSSQLFFKYDNFSHSVSYGQEHKIKSFMDIVCVFNRVTRGVPV